MNLKNNRKFSRISLLSICGFLFLTNSIFAQSLLTDQFQFNQLALNPAFAGAKENFSVNLMMGNQFNGSIRPQQVHQILSADAPIQNKRGGIGLQAFSQNGFNSGINANYAYRFNVLDLFKVGVGINGGVTYFPVQNTQTVGQLFGYGGYGVLLNAERFFASFSKPTAFIDKNSFFSDKKSFYSMFGFSLGDYFHSMFNVSAAIESVPNSSNNLYLTGKAWFSRRVGLGASYRSQMVGGARDTKFIWMAEYQFSPSFRMGAAYDPKPFSLFSGLGGNNQFQQRGILQLLFRYELIRDDTDEREIYRLKYY